MIRGRFALAKIGETTATSMRLASMSHNSRSFRVFHGTPRVRENP